LTSFYWNELTAQELQLICGTYHVDTRMWSLFLNSVYALIKFSAFPDQTSLLSWFPPEHHFLHSGMNVGFWSNDCESWYQMRLGQIRSGTRQLLSAIKWKTWSSSKNRFVHASLKVLNARVMRVFDDRSYAQPSASVLDCASEL
jgi:hypothetical protein